MNSKLVESNYIPQLDGIRAIAALFVMYFHFFQFFPVGGTSLGRFLVKTSVIGQTGVSLFFVLSGFLITRILLATKSKPHYFKNFYIKRSLRIIPLYFLTLLLYYYVYKPLLFNISPSIHDQFIFATYLQNIYLTFIGPVDGPGHFWSLAVEEHFYLFWPFLVFMVNIKYLHKWVIALVLLSIVSRVVLLQYNFEVFYFTLTRLDDICMGTLLAILVTRQENVKEYFRGRKLWASGAMYMLLILVLWLLLSGKADQSLQVVKYTLIGILYFVVLGYSISNENLATKILGIKPLVFLGKISYGLYVFHPFCYHLTDKYVPHGNWVVSIIINFAFTIGIASLSFYLFERHFLKLKHRFDFR